MLKRRKCHRSVLDFDAAFIRNVLVQTMQNASAGVPMDNAENRPEGNENLVAE